MTAAISRRRQRSNARSPPVGGTRSTSAATVNSPRWMRSPPPMAPRDSSGTPGRVTCEGSPRPSPTPTHTSDQRSPSRCSPRPRIRSVEPDPPVEAGRGVDVEHPDGGGAVVSEGVLDPGRDEDERPGPGRHLSPLEQEDHLALEDVERVVLGLVDVGLELAPGGDLDDREVEPRGVGAPCEE